MHRAGERARYHGTSAAQGDANGTASGPPVRGSTPPASGLSPDGHRAAVRGRNRSGTIPATKHWLAGTQLDVRAPEAREIAEWLTASMMSAE